METDNANFHHPTKNIENLWQYSERFSKELKFKIIITIAVIRTYLLLEKYPLLFLSYMLSIIRYVKYIRINRKKFVHRGIAKFTRTYIIIGELYYYFKEDRYYIYIILASTGINKSNGPP